MFNAEVWNQYGTFCFEFKICLFWYQYVTEINDFEFFLPYLSRSNLGPGTFNLFLRVVFIISVYGLFEKIFYPKFLVFKIADLTNHTQN